LVFFASVPELATVLDQTMISRADIAAQPAFVPITITGGVLAERLCGCLANDQAWCSSSGIAHFAGADAVTAMKLR
jgi:hypothetical protein